MRKLFSIGRHALVVLALFGVIACAALVPEARAAAVLLAVILAVRIFVLWFVGSSLWQGMNATLPPLRTHGGEWIW